jgi:hypothetical protein
MPLARSLPLGRGLPRGTSAPGEPAAPRIFPAAFRTALRSPLAAGLCLVLSLTLLSACSTSRKKAGKTVLATKQGETSIQIVEAEEDGNQVVRINTRYKGEDHSIVMQIDQPVYDVEIPLTVEQIAPQTAAAARGPEGQFQDLLISQYFERAQESMLSGDYPGALRQVNLVLLTRPDHIQGHAMKGSVYYAMGSYQLAEEEWNRTLALDPSNQEVRTFMDFLKNRKGAPQPPLPGAPGAPAGATVPKGAAPGQPAQPAGKSAPGASVPAQPRQGGSR